MNLSVKQRQTHRHREDLWLLGSGEGKGELGILGLTDADYYIKND